MGGGVLALSDIWPLTPECRLLLCSLPLRILKRLLPPDATQGVPDLQ